MLLKEKCIYYNPIQKGYYLVLGIDDELIYGRRGEYINTSNLEDWINQDGPGLCFKIDDIIICRDYIRNYYPNEKCLEQFELIKELSDEEFGLISILTNAKYSFPAILIDMTKCNNNFIKTIVNNIDNRKLEVTKLNLEICNLERGLFELVSKENI